MKGIELFSSGSTASSHHVNTDYFPRTAQHGVFHSYTIFFTWHKRCKRQFWILNGETEFHMRTSGLHVWRTNRGRGAAGDVIGWQVRGERALHVSGPLIVLRETKTWVYPLSRWFIESVATWEQTLPNITIKKRNDKITNGTFNKKKKGDAVCNPVYLQCI